MREMDLSIVTSASAAWFSSVSRALTEVPASLPSLIIEGHPSSALPF